MRTAFCTTCRGRLHDLKKTLPGNLRLLGEGEQLVLVDYNSGDGLRDWVLTSFALELQTGRLDFYSEQTAPRFVMSHAKNLAHLLGILRRAEVVVNLDADNYLSPEYLASLRAVDWQTAAMTEPQDYSGGLRGRVALRSDVFYRLGGYNEVMDFGYGYEEIDLGRRVRLAPAVLGIPGRVIKLPVPVSDTIPTSMALKLEAQKHPALTSSDSQNRHRAISERGLRARQVVVNAGRAWGQAELLNASGVRLAFSSLVSQPSSRCAGSVSPAAIKPVGR